MNQKYVKIRSIFNSLATIDANSCSMFANISQSFNIDINNYSQFGWWMLILFH